MVGSSPAVYDKASWDRKVAYFEPMSKFTTGGNKCIGSFFGTDCETVTISGDDEVKISANYKGSFTLGMYDSNNRYHEFKFPDMCEETSTTITCIPKHDRTAGEFQLHWAPDKDTFGIEGKTGDGTYPIYKRSNAKKSMKLKITDLFRGSEVTDFKIISKDVDWMNDHLKKGATQAWTGGKCDLEHAPCGGSCWGVCNGYCMCYPNGYKGVSGTFHPGASCLKACGAGEAVEAAAEGATGHLVHAGFQDKNDDGFDDEMLERIAKIQEVLKSMSLNEL